MDTPHTKEMRKLISSDQTFKDHCPSVQLSCCSTEEIVDKFNFVTQKMEKYLHDLSSMILFFKFIKNLSINEIVDFMYENWNHLKLC